MMGGGVKAPVGDLRRKISKKRQGLCGEMPMGNSWDLRTEGWVYCGFFPDASGMNFVPPR